MAANSNPTVRRRRLGAELRRLGTAGGLKSTEVAERLMVSQPKISHLENGNRAVSSRDVRDLCALYGVTDQQVIDTLLQMAKESDSRAGGTLTATSPRASTVREIVPKADLPFGFQVPHTDRVQPLDLQPGDRLVMLTDGMLERNANSLDRAHPRATSPRGRPHSDRGGRRRQPRPPGGRRDRHVPGLARRRPLRAGRRHGADLTDASDTPLRPFPGPAAGGDACPADRVTGEGACGGCPGAGRGGRSRRPEPPRR